VHGTGVYSVGVGPKGPALERFLDIKKKKLFLSSYIIFIDFPSYMKMNSSLPLEKGNLLL
jgi:hypothetical protein